MHACMYAVIIIPVPVLEYRYCNKIKIIKCCKLKAIDSPCCADSTVGSSVFYINAINAIVKSTA